MSAERVLRQAELVACIRWLTHQSSSDVRFALVRLNAELQARALYDLALLARAGSIVASGAEQ